MGTGWTSGHLEDELAWGGEGLRGHLDSGAPGVRVGLGEGLLDMSKLQGVRAVRPVGLGSLASK